MERESSSDIKHKTSFYGTPIVSARFRADEWTTNFLYPVVIITCVHYLGPPGPFSFPDSRDLLEVLAGLPWQRERGGP